MQAGCDVWDRLLEYKNIQIDDVRSQLGIVSKDQN